MSKICDNCGIQDTKKNGVRIIQVNVCDTCWAYLVDFIDPRKGKKKWLKQNK